MNRSLRWLALLAIVPTCCVTACSAEDAKTFRVWQTKSGRKSDVKLQFVEQSGDNVKLKREDNGKVVSLPLAQLSEADQRLIAQMNTATTGANDDTVFVATTTETQGWPRWRGPKNDGISTETGLMQSWDTEPSVLWSCRGLGQGYSSVSIANGKIYTLGRKDGDVMLMCLSLEDGSSIWETSVGKGDAPNCTPTVDADAKLAYGISHRGDLLCADSETGDVKWRKNFKQDFNGSMMSGWGYSESPLIDGDRLIITPGSDQAVLAAVDKRTGEVIWKTPMQNGRAGYASPVISNAGGIKQYVTLVGQGLIGVAAADGRPLWHYKRIANGTANVPTPLVSGDYVFGSSGYGDGGSALLKLRKQGRGIQYEEVYYKKNSDYQNHHGGMVLIDGHVYMGEGHNKGFPMCIDMKTGRAKWGPERGAGNGSAALVAADGNLYFRYENAVMALVKATPQGYELKGKFKIASNNGKSWAHPVIADKKLYLRDQDELHCYDIAAK